MFFRSGAWISASFFFCFSVFGQTPPVKPIIGARGVLHGATFQRLAGGVFQEPAAGLAPGALFRIEGGHLGPEELVVGTAPFGLRLPDVPGGTEVRVRSLFQGSVAQARLVFVQADQLAAILPSPFPVGPAEVTVWRDGLVSDPVTVPVLFSFPGLFTLAQNGVGRAVVHHYEGEGAYSLNGLTSSAKPGQIITLWGTGLGQARVEDTRVYFGQEFYPAEYAGPAPGAPGLDQINVRIPEDLPERGCYVRLVVAGDGLGSGPASIAIEDEGGPCEHPWGLSAKRMAEIEAGERATHLSFWIVDSQSNVQRVTPPAPESYGNAGGQSATYDVTTLEPVSKAAPDGSSVFDPAPGTCESSGVSFDPGLPPFPDPPPPDPAPPSNETPAGYPWIVSGPGSRRFELTEVRGNNLSAEGPEAAFLTPGVWTVETPGGTAIPATTFSLRMPELPEVAAPSAVGRGEDLVLSWDAGQVQAGDRIEVGVRIWPAAPDTDGAYHGTSLRCVVAPEANSMTAPLGGLGELLDRANELEVSFRVRSSGTEARPESVDHVLATATSIRHWTVSLE